MEFFEIIKELWEEHILFRINMIFVIIALLLFVVWLVLVIRLLLYC